MFLSLLGVMDGLGFVSSFSVFKDRGREGWASGRCSGWQAARVEFFSAGGKWLGVGRKYW